MAKVFYIAMVDADTTQAFFFNNKKKAQEKGMELYDGFGEFSFDLRGEEFEGDYATTYIYSGIENVKEGFLFYREAGRPHFEAGSEADARAAVISGSFEAGGAMGGYFPAKLKAGYGEIYMSSAVEGTNELWTFEADELYEKEQTPMKYVPTFESFIALNEASADLRVATPKTKMLIKDCKKIFMKGPKKPDEYGTWHAGPDKEPGNNWIESLMRVFKSYGKVKVHKWKDGDQLVQIDIEGQDGSLYVADKLMGFDHYDKRVGEHFLDGRLDTFEHGNGPEFTPGIIYFNLGPSV